jgi:hypothetical protein
MGPAALFSCNLLEPGYDAGMKKLLIGLAVLIIIGAVTLFVMGSVAPQAAADYKSATYTIDGASVALVNGRAETAAAPGSASKIVTEYFGNEAKGDLNGDTIPDLAFLLTQSGGGSGTFYYVVAALQTSDGKYTGTNAVLLGDRVHPQSTNIIDGQLVVNYGERKAGEPMTAEVTVGVSKYLKVVDGTLAPAGLGIEWIINDSGAFAESGAPLTTIAIRVDGTLRSVGTFEGSCSDMKTTAWKMDANEIAGVVCWFAGGGQEIGVFDENGDTSVKVGFLEEGTAEGPGYRGDFNTLFEI